MRALGNQQADEVSIELVRHAADREVVQHVAPDWARKEFSTVVEVLLALEGDSNGKDGSSGRSC